MNGVQILPLCLKEDKLISLLFYQVTVLTIGEQQFFCFFFWTVFPVLLYVFVPKASGWLFKSPWPRLWLSFLLLLSLPESLSFPYSGGRNLTSNIWIYSLSCARFTKTYRLSIRPRVMKAFTLTEQRGHGGDQITTAFLAIEPAMTNVTVWATCKNVHHLTLQSLTSLL